MTRVKRILLVDDDGPLRRSLAEQLRLDEAFEVEEAETAEAALLKVRATPFAAILLDIGLPDRDGHALCQAMRQAGVRSPVILLVPAGIRTDSARDREAGVSDTVSRPFRFGVLLTRLKTHLLQFERSEDNIFVIGPYNFQPAARSLQDQRANRHVRLTEKETAILKYLYAMGRKVVGREVLLGEVWGYNAGVTTHTLETHVYRLRQKIEADPSNAQILITEPGGYRLVP